MLEKTTKLVSKWSKIRNSQRMILNIDAIKVFLKSEERFLEIHILFILSGFHNVSSEETLGSLSPDTL